MYLMWHCPERVARRHVMNVLFGRSSYAEKHPKAMLSFRNKDEHVGRVATIKYL